MRRILVIIAVLLVGFIYAQPDKSDKTGCLPKYDDSSVCSVPDEQQDVIRDYLFINTECEFSSSTGGGSVSRVPTKTLQNNIFQRYLDVARQHVTTNIKIFTLRATLSLKRLPLSKNYYIYYLSRIIC